ncbi:single-stranded DNA-binding protein [Actinobacteria bacterium YIM 96077]|uniref:Single-stranded DNA-binding protein n=1 Tax=Phytoactinopolyspora halophila TaxID=1981511 RepID=A0A329QE27_9ACTN|nr:single-stranded DNA-binding protein [Phytoactinopolyspora halophila]AYY13621.1 single-stranded DNA-binding protein [Actinobacteria bacterium YIM 96077]RAW10713.1 single-stranded DNA-binding protein [Phytoactinopolyspora halophila]
MSAAFAPAIEHRNEVRLVGRVAAEPKVTAMPSGDEVVNLRLIVGRQPGSDGRRRRPSVDTVMCAAWNPLARRRVRMWDAGDIVEVRGSLRRRFWRAQDGPRNRYEVEVETGFRLARASGGESQPEQMDRQGHETT